MRQDLQMGRVIKWGYNERQKRIALRIIDALDESINNEFDREALEGKKEPDEIIKEIMIDLDFAMVGTMLRHLYAYYGRYKARGYRERAKEFKKNIERMMRELRKNGL